MKYLSLMLLLVSFSSFADRADVPCEDNQNICESRSWTDAIRLQSKSVFSRGVGTTYAAAENAANNRLYSTHKGIECGIGVAIAVSNEQIRLRDGRMVTEVWVKCSPKDDSFGAAGPKRLGTMLCGAGGKGCIIVH